MHKLEKKEKRILEQKKLKIGAIATSCSSFPASISANPG